MNNSAHKYSKSKGSQKKDELRQIIIERDLDQLIKWTRHERNPFRILSSLLFDHDPLICWRVIEAIGITAPFIAQEDIKKVRRLVRRLLWTMNDESGSLCRYAPEAIGEILFNIPALAREFGIVLISFLNEQPFESGVRWSIARLMSSDHGTNELTKIFLGLSSGLMDSLENNNPKIRGNALLAIRALKTELTDEQKKRLINDKAQFPVYNFQTGQLSQVNISSIASQMIA